MTGRRWYKRCGADFIHSTMQMTLEEKGAYCLCLDLIYDRCGPIPDDARWLAGVCGVSLRKWASLRQRLIDLGKLVAEGGFLTNRRAEVEIENAVKPGRKVAETSAKSRETEPKGARNSGEIDVDASENNGLAINEFDHRARIDKRREEKIRGSEAKASAPMTGLDLHPTGPPAADSRPAIVAAPDPEQDLFRRGREVLGKDAGGLVARLLKARGGSIPKARAAIEEPRPSTIRRSSSAPAFASPAADLRPWRPANVVSRSEAARMHDTALSSIGIRLSNAGPGNRKTTCPKCSHLRKHRTDRCLSVTITVDAAVFHCHHCGWSGGVRGHDVAGDRRPADLPRTRSGAGSEAWSRELAAKRWW